MQLASRALLTRAAASSKAVRSSDECARWKLSFFSSCSLPSTFAVRSTASAALRTFWGTIFSRATPAPLAALSSLR